MLKLETARRVPAAFGIFWTSPTGQFVPCEAYTTDAEGNTTSGDDARPSDLADAYARGETFLTHEAFVSGDAAEARAVGLGSAYSVVPLPAGWTFYDGEQLCVVAPAGPCQIIVHTGPQRGQVLGPFATFEEAEAFEATIAGNTTIEDVAAPVEPAKVEFVRVERDCPRNSETRAAGATRGIIYDYNVLIGGEHRATMCSEASLGRGYRLYDADHRPIVAPNRTWATHLGETVEKKADFEPIVSEYLAVGRIPTLAQMADLRQKEQETALAERRERLDKAREFRINSHGIELYNALAAFRDHPDVGPLLAKIDGEVATSLAYVTEQDARQ